MAKLVWSTVCPKPSVPRVLAKVMRGHLIRRPLYEGAKAYTLGFEENPNEERVVVITTLSGAVKKLMDYNFAVKAGLVPGDDWLNRLR